MQNVAVLLLLKFPLIGGTEDVVMFLWTRMLPCVAGVFTAPARWRSVRGVWKFVAVFGGKLLKVIA